MYTWPWLLRELTHPQTNEDKEDSKFQKLQVYEDLVHAFILCLCFLLTHVSTISNLKTCHDTSICVIYNTKCPFSFFPFFFFFSFFWTGSHCAALVGHCVYQVGREFIDSSACAPWALGLKACAPPWPRSFFHKTVFKGYWAMAQWVKSLVNSRGWREGSVVRSCLETVPGIQPGDSPASNSRTWLKRK